LVETNPNVFYINKKLNKMNFKINIGTTLLTVVIFNRGYLKSRLTVGVELIVIGKIDFLHNTIVASEIRFGKINEDGEVEAIYHTTYGIDSRMIRTHVNLALQNKDINLVNYVPSDLMEKYHFMDKNKAIRIVHQPQQIDELKKATLMLKYEELFLFMLRMNYLKLNKYKHDGLPKKIDYNLVLNLINKLPYTLTDDQNNAIQDIYNDMISNKRMNRLLQGDVGSGKTIVAFISMYMNYLSGYQSALMAPTEVLAIQHYQNINNIFSNLNIKIALLTGKVKTKEKKEIYQKLMTGELDIVIGTHALVVDKVSFSNLGLVVTDEQHRFGVNQRGILKNKGQKPDILYLSATPIPRTYALTLYGDMDISSIKTMPSGRKEIKTFVKKEKQITEVLKMMLNELKLGHQIYIIAPLIEESEKIDLENINDIEDKMNRAFGKLYNIKTLHGKMKNDDKDIIMRDFKDNKINILISTTVIEVGIDVPNATMMVIFDSFRFGLSTLHQLRGRVGRSNLQSYCILMSNKQTERLSVLEKTNDGFLISEEDFRLRGSGDLFGYKQSGDMAFAIANLKNDYSLLMRAKDDSLNILDKKLYKDTILEKIINEMADLN
ncbi:MAG: ATP-dependent DNA helicase RecG, partial [Bacilli bacterium]|nr:ATP-dependent DNA helicase RecG [Bacilli bacterium]